MPRAGYITRFLATGVLLGVMLSLSACKTPAIVIDKQSTIDSLSTELALVRDTLSFYESIDSGSYYRELRIRDVRINELEYMLNLSTDGGSLLSVEFVDDLFQPASATLLESGKARLDSLGRRISALSASQKIRIEAHSDNVPPGPTISEIYPTNWELSAARASAVARYFMDTDILTPERAEVVSLGDSRPADTNETARGRKQNRRIVFRLPAFVNVDNSE